MNYQVFLTCFCLTILGIVANSGAMSINNKTTINLEDILSYKYSAAAYGGNWISDNILEYNEGGDIYNHNVDNNEHKLILDGSIFNQYENPSISFSPDKQFVLITYAIDNTWRYSSLARYDIYDVNLETFESIYPPPEENNEEGKKLSLFRWATEGNSFAFVHYGNIYYRASAVKVSPPVFLQLTTDGTKDGKITNGHTDWVYEEEMFGTPVALWFSKDSSQLAFVRFDDTEVSKFQFPIYGEPGDRQRVYPKWIEIFYPKAGTNNPKVELKIINFQAAAPVAIPVTYPTQDTDNRHYIARVIWLSSTRVMVIHLNRNQNTDTNYGCQIVNENTAPCTLLFQRTVENKWLDVYTPRVSTNGNNILTLRAVEVLPGVTYTQIVKIDLTTGTLDQLITKEKYSVTSILGWDESDINNQKVYFAATGFYLNGNVTVIRPSESHIYVINIAQDVSKAVCITCNFVNSDGKSCGANRASFSPSYTKFLHACAGPDIPEETLREVTKDYPIKLPLEDNSNLRDLLKNVNLPKIMDLNVVVPKTSFVVNIRLILPPAFDVNSSKQYPLLINVYGGPGSQQINSNFGLNWGTSLATDKEVIYGYIDGRGSGGQTVEHLSQLYRKLGTVEIQDQIFATKWLIGNSKFIDPKRTAIWGWSYGGYATSLVLATDTENVFKCGIAVAPVTSWLYYDTIYTERFMGLPTTDDNWDAYNTSQVTTNVKNFHNKEFLLVHGNADDNVHYQQSMILARALEKADIMFDQLSYPDEAHGITGVRNHLYHSFEKFLFNQCFNKVKLEDPGKPPSGSSAIGPFVHLMLAATVAIFYRFRSIM